MRIQVECAHCGAEITVEATQEEGVYFCSLTCYERYTRLYPEWGEDYEEYPEWHDD